MVDRIERVSALKPVESGIGKFFERKEGYEDHPKNKKQFAEILNHEMEKEARPDNEAGPGVPNAYRLELRARPTQSLFYQSDVDLSKAEGKIHDAG
ncbi:hypothetical protein SAMN05216584_101212 [Selenomonas sp. WCT3]|uniref:hypothetical protein n=1 Tax=Selenomonas sp. WCT3 TaxID=3158785 RepID=UPI00088FC116|nr:hypothetical protein SAMN05216584_101212 [Selenomonas ruminantium]